MESSHKTRPVKIPAQVPQTGTGQRVSVLKKPAANSSPDRLETSFLRGTRIENLKRSTWWMWATRYERSFKGVFAMMTSKAKRDAARYYQSWHADTIPLALRAVSSRPGRLPQCEGAYGELPRRVPVRRSHAHCRVCVEAIKTDEPKHNIRADAKWVHVDCPPISPRTAVVRDSAGSAAGGVRATRPRAGEYPWCSSGLAKV